MSVKSDIYKSALRDYDSIKSASEAKKRALKKQVYDKNPRLEEIDRKINSIGVAAAMETLKNPQNKEKIIFDMKASLMELETEKKMIFKELGIDKSYFDTAYRCPICKDTGMVGNEECQCFRQYLIEKAYGRAMLSETNETFETFNPDFYSKTEKDRHGITPYENMRLIYETCRRFAERLPEYRNLLLMGKTGLGKTFLCNSIARAVLDRGFTVIYISAGRLFRTLADEQFNRGEEEMCFLDDVLSVDLLIIDDLGTEFSTSLVASQFFNILNERMCKKLPIVVSTNLTPNNIKEQYSDRVLSRMGDEFEFLTLTGEDIRILKRFN